MTMSRGRSRFTILIVDDEEQVHSSLQRFFSRYNYVILSAKNGEEALDKLDGVAVDLMLLDLLMPGIDGMTVLKKACEKVPDLKVIIQTGHGGVAEAVEALKHGASDFLEKGASPEILRKRVGQIYELWLLEQKNKALERQRPITFSYDQMVGESPAMAKLKDMIVRVAPTDTTVLIQGESGTGKELIARAIHYHSARAKQPFVVVDCASISETVIESELFGHTKGAFTGADSATLGLIRAADKGTLFLDEVGELSQSVQAKFLRTIQERIVRPVGSTRNYSVDIRIVAATNRNLLDEVSANTFRQDLYYRLTPVTLISPPLRERKGDIELLADRILTQSSGKDVTVSAEALAMIKAYDWPGNVRELENVLKGAMVFACESCIRPADLPPAVGGEPSPANAEELLPAGTLASYELEAIRSALALADNNRRKAAKILNISEATLYRKIKQYRL